MATFELPYPPSVNLYWRHRVFVTAGPRGNASCPRCRARLIARASFYIGEKGKRFREDVRAALLARFGRIKATGERVAVRIDVHVPDRRKRDMDNIPKAVLDALVTCGGLLDDEQVDEITIRRRGKIPGGLLRVELVRMEAQEGLIDARSEGPAGAEDGLADAGD